MLLYFFLFNSSEEIPRKSLEGDNRKRRLGAEPLTLLILFYLYSTISKRYANNKNFQSALVDMPVPEELNPS